MNKTETEIYINKTYKKHLPQAIAIAKLTNIAPNTTIMYAMFTNTVNDIYLYASHSFWDNKDQYSDIMHKDWFLRMKFTKLSFVNWNDEEILRIAL